MGHEVIDLRSSGEDDRVEDDNFQSCLLQAQPGLRFGTGNVNGKRAFKNPMLLFELGLVSFVDAGQQRQRCAAWQGHNQHLR